MIGLRLTEGDAVYEVTGAHGGRYVLARLDAFETPISATPAELAGRFTVAAEPPPEGDPCDDWAALDRAHRDAQTAARPMASTPEQVFAAAAPKAASKPAAPRKRGLDADARRRLGHTA
jgi:hypothetical protein